MFETIKDCYENKQHPIVHDDSLTYWGNLAVENYGLEIKDIMKMKPGEKIKVILFDRNVGDYMHETKIGTVYDPTKKGLQTATYIHGQNLTGILIFDGINVVHPAFTWEINGTPYGKSFWCPLSCEDDLSKLNKKTKIGWRGPCILLKDAKKLPKKVKHYGTWWDDYMVWKYMDFLNKK